MSFNEDDKVLMTQVAESIAGYIPHIFPQDLAIESTPSITTAKLQVCPTHKLNWETLDQLLSLLDITIGKLYSVIVGVDWKAQKAVELQEPGLVYVWYELDGKIVGFVSFMLVLEDGLKKLYLYEIHVHPQYQHAKLGSSLINSFHRAAKYLDTLEDPLLSCKGTSLTVFSQNNIAHNWYEKLGYRPSESSPMDRTLRSGRVVKPNYYIMTRDN